MLPGTHPYLPNVKTLSYNANSYSAKTPRNASLALYEAWVYLTPGSITISMKIRDLYQDVKK